MDSYFSFETPSYPTPQPPCRLQPSPFARPQSPTLQFFTNNHTKHPSFFQEDLFLPSMEADWCQTESLSPSDFVSLDHHTEPSPSYFESFFNMDAIYEDFNPALNATSFRNNVQELNFQPVKQSETSQYKEIPSPQSNMIETDISQEGSNSPLPFEETTSISGNVIKGWNEDDEKLLRHLVVQYKSDWKKIAKKFDNKKYTAHFLKMKYKGYDEGPVPKRVKFTHEEDLMIAQYFSEYGVDWEKIATHFSNRTPIMLKNRYYSHIRKNKRLESLLKEAERPEIASVELPVSSSLINDCTEIEIQIKSGDCFGSMLGTSEGDARKSDEEALLRAQVKSLKSLYLITHKELVKLKNKRVRGKPNYQI